MEATGIAAGQGTMLEIIAFHLGDQQFCIKTTSIREISAWAAATPLPHAPPEVIRVMNLRGSVMPIIDLAARLISLSISRENPLRCAMAVLPEIVSVTIRRGSTWKPAASISKSEFTPPLTKHRSVKECGLSRKQRRAYRPERASVALVDRVPACRNARRAWDPMPFGCLPVNAAEI